MSETLKPISERIDDKALAYHLAHLQKPFKDVELAFIQDNKLEIAKQVAHKGLSVVATSENRFSEHLDTNYSLENKVGLSRERISQIANESDFAAHTWIYGREIPNDKINGGGQWTSLYNRNRRMSQRQSDNTRNFYKESSAELLNGFVDAGISELVTISIAPDNVKFKEVVPESSKGEDGIIGIHYYTLSRFDSYKFDDKKFSYLSPDGRPGNSLDVLVFLPTSDAVELIQAMKNDPNIIREFIDVEMIEQIGAHESWDQAKPPYKHWEDVNGGISRIAIRTDMSQGISQSQIIDFVTNVP